MVENDTTELSSTEPEGIDLANILIWTIVFLIISIILITSVNYINLNKKQNISTEEE